MVQRATREITSCSTHRQISSVFKFANCNVKWRSRRSASCSGGISRLKIVAVVDAHQTETAMARESVVACTRGHRRERRGEHMSGSTRTRTPTRWLFLFPTKSYACEFDYVNRKIMPPPSSPLLPRGVVYGGLTIQTSSRAGTRWHVVSESHTYEGMAGRSTWPPTILACSLAVGHWTGWLPGWSTRPRDTESGQMRRSSGGAATDQIALMDSRWFKGSLN